MKSLNLFLLLLLALLSACNNSIKHSEPQTYLAATQLTLRQTPSNKGKSLSNIMIGESFTLLDSTATDAESNLEYSKIELSDKTQGWALTRSLLPLSKLGVAVSNAGLYQRPQKTTKLRNDVALYQLILIDTSKTIDNFIPITSISGKELGWIEKSTLGTDISTQYDDIVTVLHLLAQKLIKYAEQTEILNVHKLSALHEELLTRGIQPSIITSLLPGVSEALDPAILQPLPEKEEDKSYIILPEDL